MIEPNWNNIVESYKVTDRYLSLPIERPRNQEAKEEIHWTIPSILVGRKERNNQVF
jgi:hypothetical protein